jgi:hypothetical protein
VDEAAAVGHVQGGRSFPADPEGVGRDVAEDHRRYATVESSEPEQTFAAADVEHGVAFVERGIVEDAISPAAQLLEASATLFFVAAVLPLS